jgi:integrase
MPYTVSQLTSLKATEKRQLHTLKDSKHIYYRIMPATAKHPNGARKWMVRCEFRGKEIWVPMRPTNFQDLAQWLRKRAAEILDLVEKGVDPRIQDVTEGVPLCQEGWQAYLDFQLKPNRSPVYAKAQDALWLRHPAPHLAKLPINAVTSIHCDKAVDALIKRGCHTTSNRVVSLLSAWWNWMQRVKYPHILLNTPHPMRREKLDEDPVEWSMTFEQLPFFYKAWEGAQHKQKWILMFLLITGSRIGLTCVMRREWLDQWGLKVPKKTPGAKGATHLLMGPEARAMFEQNTVPVLDEWVYDSLKEINAVVGGPFGRALNPHALRKTFSARAEEMGVPKPLVDWLINHKASKLDMSYYDRNAETIHPFLLKIEAGLLEHLRKEGPP